MTLEDKEPKGSEEQDNQAERATRRVSWWISIIGAIAVYCTLKYILPTLKPSSQTLYDLFQMGPVVAPVLTIPLLLLAAKQLYDSDIPRKEIDKENLENN